MVDGVDLVAKGLEELPEHLFAAGRRQDGELRLERQGGVDELRACLRLAGERRAEHTCDRHAEEGRRDVWAVVDVLIEPCETDAAANEPDGVDVEEKRSRAALLGRLRI